MDIWKHGTYVDTWSIVHFLSGFVLAGGFYLYGVELVTALTISVFLLLLWEVFEWAVKVIEPSINVVIDIIIGFIGFVIGSQFFYGIGLSPVFLYAALAVTVSLATWGFFDFLKRGYR